MSARGGFKILQCEMNGDAPVPGDYDRDGETDFAVFRKTEGNRCVFKSSANSYIIENFGLNGDVPVPAAYLR